jgi:1,4-dihydroxy-2-naphthoyl-CoA synthase
MPSGFTQMQVGAPDVVNETHDIFCFNKKSIADEALPMGSRQRSGDGRTVRDRALEVVGDLRRRDPFALAVHKIALSERRAGLAGQARIANDL